MPPRSGKAGPRRSRSSIRRSDRAHSIRRSARSSPRTSSAMPAAWRSTPISREPRNLSGGAPRLKVIEADFTRLEPDRQSNLILTNPPYVRHHHLAREDKEDCSSSPRNGSVSGSAAWPASMPTSSSWPMPGWPMRARRLADPLRIHGCELRGRHQDLPGRAGDAPADPPLRPVGRAVPRCDGHIGHRRLRQAPPPSGHEVRMSFGGPLSTPAASESVSLATLRSARKWTAFPGNGDRRPSPTTRSATSSPSSAAWRPGPTRSSSWSGPRPGVAASQKCSSSRSCRVRDISRGM